MIALKKVGKPVGQVHWCDEKLPEIVLQKEGKNRKERGEKQKLTFK